MRKSIFILITISLLLQSCYSYKTINPSWNYLVVGRTYKIKQSNKFEKVKLKSFTDSTITVTNGINEKQILKADILKMKEREFHIGKTVSFITTAVVVGSVGAYLSDD